MAAKTKTQTTTPAAPKAASNPKFKVVRTLQLPVLKIEEGTPVYLKINDPVSVSTVPGKKNADGTFQKPADICHVTNMETGENVTFLVPAVVKGVFKDAYPDNAYVGKCFEFVKGPKEPGKRHNAFTVNEVSEEA